MYNSGARRASIGKVRHMRKKAESGIEIANQVGMRAASDAFANGVSKEEAIQSAIEDVCWYKFDELASTFGSYDEAFTYWMDNTVGGRDFIDTVYAEFDDEYEWYE